MNTPDIEKMAMPTGYPFTLFSPSRQAWVEIRVNENTFAVYWRTNHGWATRFASEESANYWLELLRHGNVA